MSIITVSNLKGGVGKTALAVNTAHAFSKRFCETLLIDLDPQGDASRLLGIESPTLETPALTFDREGDLFQHFLEVCKSGIREVRPSLSILSADTLAGILPGGDLQALAKHGNLISRLIKELAFEYDQVIIDTPPVWGEIHDTSFRETDLIIVPIDPSEMSVRAAISLLNTTMASHQTSALLVRTLVSRKATSITKHSLRKLEGEFLSKTTDEDATVQPPKRVMLKGLDVPHQNLSLYLSYATIFRSEIVHRLSFQKKTVFENKELVHIQEGYSRVAREVEEVIALREPEAEFTNESDMNFAFA